MTSGNPGDTAEGRFVYVADGDGGVLLVTNAAGDNDHDFFQLVKETNRLAAEGRLGKDTSKIIKKEIRRVSRYPGLSPVDKWAQDNRRFSRPVQS